MNSFSKHLPLILIFTFLVVYVMRKLCPLIETSFHRMLAVVFFLVIHLIIVLIMSMISRQKKNSCLEMSLLKKLFFLTKHPVSIHHPTLSPLYLFLISLFLLLLSPPLLLSHPHPCLLLLSHPLLRFPHPPLALNVLLLVPLISVTVFVQPYLCPFGLPPLPTSLRYGSLSLCTFIISSF